MATLLTMGDNIFARALLLAPRGHLICSYLRLYFGGFREASFSFSVRYCRAYARLWCILVHVCASTQRYAGSIRNPTDFDPRWYHQRSVSFSGD
jgi:hypothetical protein